jgi:ferredoxin
MTRSYTVQIHDRRTGTRHTVQVPEDRYILQTAENQGSNLPFSCRNGACTTCAVRIRSGEIYQPEAMGLSPKLREQGYALLCVSYPRSDLEVETQDEDEVYELQFGRYFGKGKVRRGLPLDED